MSGKSARAVRKFLKPIRGKALAESLKKFRLPFWRRVAKFFGWKTPAQKFAAKWMKIEIRAARRASQKVKRSMKNVCR